ncbi:HAMP domain-containing sensor histidine kinase [Mesorhizobium sp. BAC0120]|uniref:sensor histidine kinase n=1 Tax=Mesorhizobium sp. BAC0120 TaxID=3090670 RepID=UPI00298C8EB6|nr:HAMP domain-containing sensor histidine kinase [Mesorhizobium sp. BAC0120]MDW6024782.1 HAMP domain-containing sensor histidine kinase [Mesorhizobium sp. BAC0120]
MKLLQSIRLRLLLFSLIGTAVAVAIAGAGIVTLFGRHVERRIEQELDTYIDTLSGNLRVGADGRLTIAREPADARFMRPFGGLYWQVLDESNGALLRSVSLWDAQLALPDDALQTGETHTHRSKAPDKRNVILHERLILLETPSGERPVRISVAVNEAETEALEAGFGRDLLPGLALLAGVLLVAGWLQVGAGLKPLARIRSAIAAVREGRAERLSLAAPAEIAPLVAEVNSLLEAQQSALSQARHHAADIAHGLKTPLTALAGDVVRLRAAHQNDVADDIEAVARQMQRIVDRELARSRRRYSSTTLRTPVRQTVEAIARTLARTPAGEAIGWEIEIDAALAAAVDSDDLNDVLGNLMENAARAARGRVRIGALLEDKNIQFTVADDGPAVDPAAISRLIARGARLDESGGGAGLGLAIVAEILAAHDAVPSFAQSDIGGLEVSFQLRGATGQRQIIQQSAGRGLPP